MYSGALAGKEKGGWLTLTVIVIEGGRKDSPFDNLATTKNPIDHLNAARLSADITLISSRLEALLEYPTRRIMVHSM
jgi:hypothetical protein